MKYCLLLLLPLVFSCKTGAQITKVETRTKLHILDYPRTLQEAQSGLNELELPYSMDTSVLINYKAGREIPDHELRMLVSNFSNAKDDMADHYIYEVFRMNHLKQMSEYDSYVESLDIGQLKNATANYLGKIETPDKALILWTVSFTSYEACPFYIGTQVFVSLIEDRMVSYSTQIGEYMSGGDPPSMFEQFSNFKIDKDLKVKKHSENLIYYENELEENKKTDYEIDLMTRREKW